MDNQFYDPEEYFYEDPETGNIVFTERYLVERGNCCGTGCKHCPYDPSDIVGNEILKKEFEYLNNNYKNGR